MDFAPVTQFCVTPPRLLRESARVWGQPGAEKKCKSSQQIVCGPQRIVIDPTTYEWAPSRTVQKRGLTSEDAHIQLSVQPAPCLPAVGGRCPQKGSLCRGLHELLPTATDSTSWALLPWEKMYNQGASGHWLRENKPESLSVSPDFVGQREDTGS